MNSRRQRESYNISNLTNNGVARIPRDRNFSLLTVQLALFTTVGMPNSKLIVHEKATRVKEIRKRRLTRNYIITVGRDISARIATLMLCEFRRVDKDDLQRVDNSYSNRHAMRAMRRLAVFFSSPYLFP